MHVLSLFALFVLPVFGRLSSNNPVVDLGYAAFRGDTLESGVDFFGGVRYVKPPVGNLRWRAPVPLDERPIKKKNVTDARAFGDICIQQPAQLGFGSDGKSSMLPLMQTMTIISDCLTLNVWKPSNAKAGDKLSVVIYIHVRGLDLLPIYIGPYGGIPCRVVAITMPYVLPLQMTKHYTHMTVKSAKAFPMDKWVAASHSNAVAVNIQYRLGLLGFLASDAIMKDGAVNTGLLDQRAALAWVKRLVDQSSRYQCFIQFMQSYRIFRRRS
jgi:hypothetical protein